MLRLKTGKYMAPEITSAGAAATSEPKRLDFFERYLSLWVFACMVVGVALGKLLPELTHKLSELEFGRDSHVNIPIAFLIWLMIYPMMLKIDFAGLKGVAQRPKGLLITLFVNWLVKPFSMALFAWMFLKWIFGALIPADDAAQYTAGLIILAAAPCTAMVFVWSYLTEGDPAYTLAQVAVNDLIMLFAFAPIVMLLAWHRQRNDSPCGSDHLGGRFHRYPARCGFSVTSFRDQSKRRRMV